MQVLNALKFINIMLIIITEMALKDTRVNQVLNFIFLPLFTLIFGQKSCTRAHRALTSNHQERVKVKCEGIQVRENIYK